MCVNLHFSQDIHLGHGCDVALAYILPSCSAYHQELGFLSSELEWEAEAREGQGCAQGHWAGSEWSKWIEVTTRPPRSGSQPLHLATLQDWLSKDLLWVSLKGRAKPNGLVIPGYGFWAIYPFSTLLECCYVPGTVLGIGEQ